MLSARRAAEGAAFCDELRGAGHEARFIAADVTERAQVAAAVDATVEQLGRIDVVANCVSYDHMRKFVDD